MDGFVAADGQRPGVDEAIAQHIETHFGRSITYCTRWPGTW
ncbi:hypothetical protein ACIA49_25240 [Kribbella sp. NPDC051587]